MTARYIADLDYLIYEQQKRERERQHPVYEEAIIIDEYPEYPPTPKEEKVDYEL